MTTATRILEMKKTEKIEINGTIENIKTVIEICDNHDRGEWLVSGNDNGMVLIVKFN